MSIKERQKATRYRTDDDDDDGASALLSVGDRCPQPEAFIEHHGDPEVWLDAYLFLACSSTHTVYVPRSWQPQISDCYRRRSDCHRILGELFQRDWACLGRVRS